MDFWGVCLKYFHGVYLILFGGLHSVATVVLYFDEVLLLRSEEKPVPIHGKSKYSNFFN